MNICEYISQNMHSDGGLLGKALGHHDCCTLGGGLAHGLAAIPDSGSMPHKGVRLGQDMLFLGLVHISYTSRSTLSPRCRVCFVT